MQMEATDAFDISKESKETQDLYGTNTQQGRQMLIARRLLESSDELLLICGRYEGVDERVAEHLADEELSIGDYVLSGGELAAGGRTPASVSPMKSAMMENPSARPIARTGASDVSGAARQGAHAPGRTTTRLVIPGPLSCRTVRSAFGFGGSETVKRRTPRTRPSAAG